MRGLKAILGAAVVASALFVIPSGSSGTASAQISFSFNIGNPPACRWGYYDYPPYRCAPRGFYGPGYFYNGIFLGVGPWHEWGYNHGWGGHRFDNGRGGRYVPYSHGDYSHGHGRRDDQPWHDDHRDNGNHYGQDRNGGHPDNHGNDNRGNGNHGNDNHGHPDNQGQNDHRNDHH
ncbi:MAG: hypothetical protein V4555_21305 [Acidobacteriota bacterium]